MKVIVFILCLVPLFAVAQKKDTAFNKTLLFHFKQPVKKYNFKRVIAPAAFSAFAGVSWGLNQVLQPHNSRFFKTFPNASRHFYGPDSWKNKYWGNDPDRGRNNIPIWFTDGLHLTASAAQLSAVMVGATIVIGERKPLWHYLLDMGICAVSYTAGNYLAYDRIKH